MWVIRVLAGDRRRPIGASTAAISSRRASASLAGAVHDQAPVVGLCRGPGYADHGLGSAGQGGEQLAGIGIILRGWRVVCLSGVVSVSSRREMIMETDAGSGCVQRGRGAAGGVPRLAGPGAGPLAGVGALLFQAVEGVPGRDRRGGRGQRAWTRGQ